MFSNIRPVCHQPLFLQKKRSRLDRNTALILAHSQSANTDIKQLKELFAWFSFPKQILKQCKVTENVGKKEISYFHTDLFATISENRSGKANPCDLDYFLKSSSNFFTASDMVFVSPKARTNALPIIAPLEWAHAASNVSLLETPKPTKVGFLSFMSAMRLK